MFNSEKDNACFDVVFHVYIIHKGWDGSVKYRPSYLTKEWVVEIKPSLAGVSRLWGETIESGALHIQNEKVENEIAPFSNFTSFHQCNHRRRHHDAQFFGSSNVYSTKNQALLKYFRNKK